MEKVRALQLAAILVIIVIVIAFAVTVPVGPCYIPLGGPVSCVGMPGYLCDVRSIEVGTSGVNVSLYIGQEDSNDSNFGNVSLAFTPSNAPNFNPKTLPPFNQSQVFAKLPVMRWGEQYNLSLLVSPPNLTSCNFALIGYLTMKYNNTNYKDIADLGTAHSTRNTAWAQIICSFGNCGNV